MGAAEVSINLEDESIPDIKDELKREHQHEQKLKRSKTFNWGKDKSTDTSTIKERKSFFKRLPLFFQNVIFAVIVICGNDKSVAFTKYTSKTFGIENLPVLFWSVYLSVSWTTYYLLDFLFKVLPEIFNKLVYLIIGLILENIRVASKVSGYIDYSRHLQKYITYFTWSILNFITYIAIFGMQKPGSYEIVQKICISICVIFGVSLIEKFCLQIFAVHFHKRAYSDRLENQNYCENLLEKLSKSIRISEDVTLEQIEKENGGINDKFNSIRAKVFLDLTKVNEKVDDVALISGVLRYGNPYKFGKRLFDSLAKENSDRIYLSDFLKYFATTEEAEEAFLFFDKDNNGDVIKSEFKQTILEVFNEDESLEKSIFQSSQAISKLDNVVSFFSYIVILFIILAIFGVNTTGFLTVAVSLWAGLAFALDVGDRVEIDGEQFFVKEFGLNTTVFKSIEGLEIYSPNFVLLGKSIRNIRRSGPTSESVRITIALDTSLEKIENLNKFLINYIKAEESREFFPDLIYIVNNIVSDNAMTLTFWLSHKSNWQMAGRKIKRRNRFMMKLREGVQLHGIQLTSLKMEYHDIHTVN
ncbi:hypothetical protein HK099_002730 [Clydaea vesicula]|uniref:EF-hand domain-containing protein n=1 Tax=Clydaea vesicula TaxID=447962 RepID=A0AAD5U3Y8_9FUNG|nr:hypothetical protein HK099_002730 [Clydaea vesicula]